MIKDMTRGHIGKILFSFSLPMLLSVLFQQMYTLTDSLIAGRILGENALASIGVSYPLTMLFMALAVGTNIACTVVVSQLFGAKEYEKVKSCISTTFITSSMIGLLLSIIGIFLSSNMLSLIHTPLNIFSDSKVYLNVYIAGFVFLYMYNVATGIFSALGDARTPLYFLILSSLLNIILDLIFVTGFPFGVMGLALATLISQAIFSVLSVHVLQNRLKTLPCVPYSKFSCSMLKKIVRIAVPSIIQQSFISVGNVLVQGLINSFGSYVVAGFSTASKLNTFALTCYNTLGSALSSFCAQNIGAGRLDRVPKGFRYGLVYSLGIASLFFGVYFFFPEEIVSLFIKNPYPETVQTAVCFLKCLAPLYFLIQLKILSDGVLRGAGKMKYFMLGTCMDLALRVLLGYFLSEYMGVYGIWIAWIIGWVSATVLIYSLYKKGIYKTYNRV